MDIIIKDNFMPKDIFENFTSNFTKIPWYTSVIVSGDAVVDKNNNFQFVHPFYRENYSSESSTSKIKHSPFFDEFIKPILPNLGVEYLIRVKANLIPRSDKIIKQGFHIDQEHNDYKGLTDCFASILYFNTNNGYTEFKDGTRIGSVENRLVTFPLSYYHRGVSCTDKPYRIVINFNYFKKLDNTQ